MDDRTPGGWVGKWMGRRAGRLVGEWRGRRAGRWVDDWMMGGPVDGGVNGWWEGR